MASFNAEQTGPTEEVKSINALSLRIVSYCHHLVFFENLLTITTDSFQYRFHANGQAGTFWYHSHHRALYPLGQA
jgi:ferric iron reductase protein FhuF